MSKLTSSIALILALSGCTASHGAPGDLGDLPPAETADPASSPAAPAPPSDHAPTWTVFVYGHGDHNLSPSLAIDIQKMSKAKLGAGVKVVVLADWNASLEDEDGARIYPVGSEWYAIRGDGAEPELTSTEPEQDLDDPAVLRAAIARAFRDNPADRYALVLWNHGGSWDGGYGSDQQNGTRADPTPMKAPAIADAVRGGMNDAGLAPDRKLDFFAFDTCLMGGAEVALALKDLTKLYVANAEIDYGSGLAYTETLTYLARNPAASTEELARSEAEAWNALHETAGIDDALLRSHIALDPSKLDALAAAAAPLADALAKSPSLVPIAKGAYFVLPAYGVTLADGVVAPGHRDYGQFLEAIAADPALASYAPAAHAARKALRDATLASVAGVLRDGQSGLHVALPLPKTLSPDWFDLYGDLTKAWSSPSGWNHLLAALAAGRDDDAPTLETGIDGDGTRAIGVTVQSKAHDVGEARLWLSGLDPSDPTTRISYGIVSAAAADSSAGATLAWDGTGVAVGGQLATVVPWLSLGRAADGQARPPIVAVLGTLTLGRDVFDAKLLFSEHDDTADAVMLTTPSGQSATLTVEEILEDDATATFTPSRIGQTNGADPAPIPGTPIPIPRSGIPLATTPLPKDSYRLVVEAEDVWGNVANVSHDVELGD